MSLAHRYSAFRDRATTFLQAQDPELERLVESLQRLPEHPRNLQFALDLRAILDERVMTRHELVRICYQDFDTDEEMYAWLNALWAHLYEGGPAPPV